MIESRLFVLHVWRGHGGLRATLRAVEEPEARRFDDVQRLCSYIAGLAADADAGAMPAWRPGEAASVIARER